MSEPKWTKGPWKFYSAHLRRGFKGIILEVQNAADSAIFHWTGFDATDGTKAEKRANANLIAAAPELFEALEDAVRWLWGAYQENDSLMLDAQPVNCMSMNDMRRALAKALGKAGK